MSSYIRQIYTTDFLVTLQDALSTWRERRRNRQALSGLNDHLLRDIGLSHGDREREVNKPFWRA